MKIYPPTLPDYYAILGVAPDASDAEIKQAFRALVKRYHPDLYALNPQVVWEAELLMTEINEAYAVLSDRERRWRYDQLRQETLSAARQPRPEAPVSEAEESPEVDMGLAGCLFSAFPGQHWLSALQRWLSTKQRSRAQKQKMGVLAKAMLLPVPFCAATALSAFFLHLGQVTGHPLLGGLTAVLAYPLVLFPMLVRVIMPIRYYPLLSLKQKLVGTPLILLGATLLGWLWVILVDHNGTSSNPLDLYWWCALMSAVCVCLAYL